MTAGIDYVAAVERCGWKNEMPPTEWKALCRRLLVATDHKQACLALACLSFESDTLESVGNTIGPQLDSYTKIIKAYAAASWGKFAPRRIVELVLGGHGTVRLSFENFDRQYEVNVARRGQFFQSEVHVLVNQALADSRCDQRFIALPCSEPFLHMVFISPAAIERLLCSDEFVAGIQALAASTFSAELYSLC
jgi:hypothetical protein